MIVCYNEINISSFLESLWKNQKIPLHSALEYDKIEDAGIAENPVTLDTNEFFTLGDNINNSEDSRSGNIGAVPRDDIIGKVWFHMASGNSPMGLME
jgi:hypothetical protein